MSRRSELIRPAGQPRRLLEPPLAVMIEELSRKFGKCFASEAALRHELHRRTGYVCGQRSIGRVIKRLVLRGQWGSERVKPNAVKANGIKSRSGTTHTWIVSRFEQRKARRRAAEADRQRVRAAGRERARLERERIEAEQRARESQAPRARAQVSTEALLQTPPKLSDLLKPPAPDDPSTFEQVSERRRVEVARQLAELARLGFDTAADKPPDK